MLKRIGKSLPLHVKLLIYRTYIACHISFCPLVWHFCSAANTQKLERMQYRALRYVYDYHDSDYDVLLNRANMPTLELARLRLLCIEVFKAINNISPPYMCNLFKLHEKQDHNTRSVKLLIQNHYNKVTYGKNTFICFSTHLCNNLPTHVSQRFDPLLPHYSIHHFMNEEIDSCEREPYFDQSKSGHCHRIRCFLIDKPCM